MFLRKLHLFEAEGPHYKKQSRPASPGRFKKDIRGNFKSTARPSEQSSDEILISCVGDIMCEQKLYDAYVSSQGTDGKCYDFNGIYPFVSSVFRASDFVIANLETTICQSSPYTGEQYRVDGKYHMNAPLEFLDAVKNAGIDFLVLANNHCLDSGYSGIKETLRHIDKRHFMRTGLFSPGERKRYTMVEVKGMKIAVLAYTTWFNRNESRFTKLGRKQILNAYSKSKAERDIAAARSAGAEYVIVYIHWGIDAEYKSTPSSSMKRMAQELADADCDYIVGSHTHSLQPQTALLSSSGKKVPCIFSLGNFVTSEKAEISHESAILQIRLKRENGTVTLMGSSTIPTYTPKNFFGLAYPVVPETILPQHTGENEMDVIKELRSCYTHAKSVIRGDHMVPLPPGQTH